jgi:hypothetical protein
MKIETEEVPQWVSEAAGSAVMLARGYRYLSTPQSLKYQSNARLARALWRYT